MNFVLPFFVIDDKVFGYCRIVEPVQSTRHFVALHRFPNWAISSSAADSTTDCFFEVPHQVVIKGCTTRCLWQPLAISAVSSTIATGFAGPAPQLFPGAHCLTKRSRASCTNDQINIRMAQESSLVDPSGFR